MQGQPRLLPFPGGERQQLQGLAVDVARPVQAADVGMQAGDGEAASDDLLGNAEVRGDIGLAQAFPAQRCERLVLLQVVHRQALDVLGQRGLQRRRIVAGLQQHARQRVGSGTPSASSFLAAR